MKKALCIAVALAWLGLAGPAFSQSANCRQDGFDSFITELAEAGAGRQLAQAKFPLTEYYDQTGQGCHKSRKMDQGKARRLGTLIPSAKEQRENNYTLRTEVRGSKGHVTLVKDGSWIFERLEYTWQGDCWYLTGIQFEIDDACR